MERSTRAIYTTWRYFVVLAAFSLAACLHEEETTANDALSAGESGGDALASSSVSGSNGNIAPSILGKPSQFAVSGSEYTFKPIAHDENGDRLGFSIRNKPDWAIFDPITGELSGTPSAEDVGLARGIVISVSDGFYGDTLPPFSIRIAMAPAPGSEPTVVSPPAQDSDAENAAPDISGSPIALAAVNQLYIFQPDASDPDGEPVEFGIVNKPSWIEFDNVSGTMSGIPTEADVGTYANIWISVSDGLNISGLGPISIDVVSLGSDSVTLSWAAPTENEDGTPLTDLAGYRIRYGTQARNYPNLIDVNNPGVQTLGVDNLVPDTYFFVISAYNGEGVESNYSNEARVTLN